VFGSPFGRGRVLFLLRSPYSAARQAENVCMTDNNRLADYIHAEFASHFGSFEGTVPLARMDRLELVESSSEGDIPDRHVERVRSAEMDVELCWEMMDPAFSVALPPEMSATRRHYMISTFIAARRASIKVNGEEVPGNLVVRPVAGRPSLSALLAFAETWVRGDSS